MDANKALLYLADSIIYVSSLLRDQPRQIDRYIDYFGDTTTGPRRPAASLARRPV